MAITDYQWSLHDICMALFLPLNCDGTVADETDAYTLAGAQGPGAAGTIVVSETIDLDTTPPYGELTIDGTEVVGYGSTTAPSTFNTVTGTTLTGTYAGGEAVTVERSEPIAHCALTQSRWIPLTTDEVVDQDPSGQANQNTAYRRIAPQANGFRFESDLSSRENPRLWAQLDQYAPIMDPDKENEILGMEEIVGTSATCPTCGTSAGICHSTAVITIHNAWCGKERHPTVPYVAMIGRSLDFEPITANLVTGRGFNAGRLLAASLRSNTALVDPWGIDSRVGVTARWQQLGIKQTTIDANADLASLLANGCGCGSCPNPSIAWPSP